jgi:phenylacetate-CoA ligase
MVTPCYVLTVIDRFEKQGLDPAASSLQIGIFGAEPWTERMRREMEERAGLSEVMGPGVAQSAWGPGTACTSGRTTSTPT